MSIVLSIKNNKLSWTDTSGSVQYTIYRSSCGSGTDSFIKLGATSSLSYTDLDVTNGRTYYYYIAGNIDSNITYATYTGPADSNRASALESGRIDEKKDAVVASGVYKQGGGESVRIQRLKGRLGKCT